MAHHVRLAARRCAVPHPPSVTARIQSLEPRSVSALRTTGGRDSDVRWPRVLPHAQRALTASIGTYAIEGCATAKSHIGSAPSQARDVVLLDCNRFPNPARIHIHLNRQRKSGREERGRVHFAITRLTPPGWRPFHSTMTTSRGAFRHATRRGKSQRGRWSRAAGSRPLLRTRLSTRPDLQLFRARRRPDRDELDSMRRRSTCRIRSAC